MFLVLFKCIVRNEAVTFTKISTYVTKCTEFIVTFLQLCFGRLGYGKLRPNLAPLGQSIIEYIFSFFIIIYFRSGFVTNVTMAVTRVDV